MNKLFFEIGGNQGNKISNISLAKEAITNNIGIIVNESGIYESPPWGFESNDSFYNQTLLVETKLPIEKVLERLLEIEKLLGRVRSASRYSSRTMDIDILFYDKVIMNTDLLSIPHPRMHLRKFVLIPLCEIAPDFIHPVFNKDIKQLLNECKDDSECLKIS